MNTANWIPDLFMRRVMEKGEWTLLSPSDAPDLHDKFGADFEKSYLAYEDKARRGEIKPSRTVQAADLWEGDNVAGRGRLYRTRLGAILAEREMCSALVVVLEVCRQNSAQMTLIEDDDVIETFSTDRADDAFNIGVLPRRSRRGDDLLDGHRLNTIAEGPTI